MDLDGQHLIDDERAGRALRHRHLDAIGGADGQRIARGVFDVVIARNRRDAEEVDPWVACASRMAMASSCPGSQSRMIFSMVAPLSSVEPV